MGVADRRAFGTGAPSVILVVDDSTTTRLILRRGLVEAGHEVVEAGDGAEGLEQVRRHRPDLILLDIDMPVLDGLSMMRQLRDSDAAPDTPVLFLTARTDAAEVAAGLALGAQDYLRKPCEAGELRARVATALRLREQSLDLRRRAETLFEAQRTDPLTGVGNRRLFDDTIADLATRREPSHEIGIMIIDADHFKAVNDGYGHAIGDVVLRVIASRTAAVLGDLAVLARWGGEEFVALVPHLASIDGPLDSLAERVRAAIGDDDIVATPTVTLPLTVSIGHAVGPIAEVASIITHADQALYAAKAGGRDRVVAWTESASR